MTAALCTGTAARASCLPLRLPRLARVWCPELSVLDAEINGERIVWHVPARPANDVGAATVEMSSTVMNTAQPRARRQRPAITPDPPPAPVEIGGFAPTARDRRQHHEDAPDSTAETAPSRGSGTTARRHRQGRETPRKTRGKGVETRGPGGTVTHGEIRVLVEEAHAGLQAVDEAIQAAAEQRARLRVAFQRLQRAEAALRELEARGE